MGISKDNDAVRLRQTSYRRSRPRSLLVEPTPSLEFDFLLHDQDHHYSDGEKETASKVSTVRACSNAYRIDDTQTVKNALDDNVKTPEVAIDEKSVNQQNIQLNNINTELFISNISENITKFTIDELLFENKMIAETPEVEHMSASQLIRLYDMGIAANNINRTPPERDVPSSPVSLLILQS